MRILKLIAGFGASAFLMFKALMGQVYTLSGQLATDVGTAMDDMGESFLTNFIIVLKLAIPLIVIFVIINMIRKYIGR